MDSDSFFKSFFDPLLGTTIDQKSIQELYDRQLDAFIESYKEQHKGCTLWRHACPKVEHLFVVGRSTESFTTTMVRLKVHGGEDDGSTFTFMGSLFTRGSKFSIQFKRVSLSREEEAARAKADTSFRTLKRWRDALRLHMDRFSASLRRAQEKNPSSVPDAESAFRMCLSVLLDEHGHFPLWCLY